MNPSLLLLCLLLSDESAREKIKPVLSLLSDPQISALLGAQKSEPEPREPEKKETPEEGEVSEWLKRILQP